MHYRETVILARTPGPSCRLTRMDVPIGHAVVFVRHLILAGFLATSNSWPLFRWHSMIIPWFPWLERLSIAAGVSGFAILGAVRFGPLGLVFGAFFGLFVGRYAVNLPLMLWASWLVKSLNSRSTEDLQALFVRNPGFGRTGCYQIAALIMKNRGDDLRPVLPVLLDLMGAASHRIRLDAFATLLTGFPELQMELEDFRPEESAEVCRAKVVRLRATLVGNGILR